MKAVVLNGVTPAGQVVLSEAEIPKVRPGWAIVKVRAFGMNHSEQILRLHEIEADYIEKPVIPGIECVGEIIDASCIPGTDGAFLERACRRAGDLLYGMGLSV